MRRAAGRTGTAVVVLACVVLSAGCTRPGGQDPGAGAAPAVSGGAPGEAVPSAGEQPSSGVPSSGVPSSGVMASGGAVASGGEHADAWDVSKMPDPCLTVDSAEVTAATTLRVSAGKALDTWPPLCTFTVEGGGQEYLYVSADSRWPEARADYERQRSDSQDTKAVSGIGDQAYWLPEFTALHVLKGTNHVTVKFAGSAPPTDPLGKALAIARVALD